MRHTLTRNIPFQLSHLTLLQNAISLCVGCVFRYIIRINKAEYVLRDTPDYLSDQMWHVSHSEMRHHNVLFCHLQYVVHNRSMVIKLTANLHKPGSDV